MLSRLSADLALWAAFAAAFVVTIRDFVESVRSLRLLDAVSLVAVRHCLALGRGFVDRRDLSLTAVRTIVDAALIMLLAIAVSLLKRSALLAAICQRLRAARSGAGRLPLFRKVNYRHFLRMDCWRSLAMTAADAAW